MKPILAFIIPIVCVGTLAAWLFPHAWENGMDTVRNIVFIVLAIVATKYIQWLIEENRRKK